MITYQQAQKEHLPQMTALWCSVYGDRREYTEAFYAHWFGKCICMTALDGTHVAGILHLLPAVLQRNGRIDAAYYLYAGAVEPAYRCRGIYANLMRMICKRSAEEQRTVLGIPAEASLFPYYARFGFRPLPVYSTETVRKRGEAPQERPVMTELTAEQYARMAAGPAPAMLWDKDGLEYAFFEIRECGGFAKQFMLRGGRMRGARILRRQHAVSQVAHRAGKPAGHSNASAPAQLSLRNAHLPDPPGRGQRTGEGHDLRTARSGHGICIYPARFAVIHGGSNEGQKRRISLILKSTIGVIIIAMLFSVTLTVLSYYYYKSKSFAYYENKTTDLAKTAALLVDGDKIDTYLETGQTDEYYDCLMKLLSDVRSENSDVKYLYIQYLDLEKKESVYILDTDTEDPVPLGTRLPFSEANRNSALSDILLHPFISDEPDYGWLCSTIAPVYRSDG